MGMRITLNSQGEGSNVQDHQISESFTPPWWLKNPHLQTFLGSLYSPGTDPKFQHQHLELPDGDFLQLDWSQNPGNDTPIVLILHGLEGSSRSSYVRRLVLDLYPQGYQCLVMHFRGCGGHVNRLQRTYHSGETQDLDLITRWLRHTYPNRPIAVIGYSLGANVLLKWLGEQRDKAPIQAAVAVCPPLRLEVCARRLEHGLSRIYQMLLLKSLVNKISEKYRHRTSPLDLNRVAKARTFFEFDDAVTAPLHGFASADEYYRQSSSRPYLKSIRRPSLIISTFDDPFMTPEVLPHIDELGPQSQLEITRYGGHVGFIAARGFFGIRFWLEQRIRLYLSSVLS
jgi:predicted alpha/beta-fold hydrolase